MWVVIYGTRPEAQKLRPFLRACREAGQPVTVIATGQHTSLLAPWQGDPLLTPQVDLDLPAFGDPFDYAEHAAVELHAHLDRLRPRWVIVQGDTASAMAGATAAATLNLPLYHIEAGVRSGNPDEPWPEERFRVAIDAIASAGACPTPHTQLNLQREGKDVSRFPVTGNTGIDALLELVQPTPYRGSHTLITIHRRDNLGDRLRAYVQALLTLASAEPTALFLWPTHPNPGVQQALPQHPPQNLVLLPPIPPQPFAQLLATAACVLTDSGGVQEEACTLGIPCVVLRTVTDRPESVQLNRAVLAQPDTLITAWYQARYYGLASTPHPQYGTGTSSQTILTHIQSLP